MSDLRGSLDPVEMLLKFPDSEMDHRSVLLDSGGRQILQNLESQVMTTILR